LLILNLNRILKHPRDKARHRSDFIKVIEALARHLQQRGEIDMSECFTRGTFSPAPGGFVWERLSAR